MLWNGSGTGVLRFCLSSPMFDTQSPQCSPLLGSVGYSWLSAKEPLLWLDLLLLATCLLILWCWNMCAQATWCGRWECADVFCKVIKHTEMSLVTTVNLQYKQMSKMLEKKMWVCGTKPGLAGSKEFLGSDWMFQPVVLQPKPLKGTAVLTGVAKWKDFSEKPIERKACTGSARRWISPGGKDQVPSPGLSEL